MHLLARGYLLMMTKTNLCTCKVQEELNSVPSINKVDCFITAKTGCNILSSLLQGKFGSESLVLNRSGCKRLITPRAWNVHPTQTNSGAWRQAVLCHACTRCRHSSNGPGSYTFITVL